MLVDGQGEVGDGKLTNRALRRYTIKAMKLKARAARQAEQPDQWMLIPGGPTRYQRPQ